MTPKKTCFTLLLLCILKIQPGITFIDDKVEQIVKGFGYPIETHFVKTIDNYILRVHHIPQGIKTKTKRNRAVFVQHGLLSSSADSVFTGPDKALSLILADSGYDVWLGNARGNMFSRNHTILDPDLDKTKFWDFSFHEIGTIDLPAMIDYVLKQTGQEKLFYIGHSQGTTTFFIMASEKPEYNDKILAQFSLAPAIYMGNIKNPIFHWLSNFNSLINLMGLNEFGPASMTKFEVEFCKNRTEICINLVNLGAGFNPDLNEQDPSITLKMLDLFPSGASIKQVLHYLQEIKSGQFRQYDYGLKNHQKYKSFQPPLYNLTKVTAPVYIFYSTHDWLASAEKDVYRLCDEIQKCKRVTCVANGTYNHFDFLMGMHAPKFVFKPIINVMKMYGNGLASEVVTSPFLGPNNGVVKVDPSFLKFLIFVVFILHQKLFLSTW